MGGLEKRIEALEYRWGMDEDREARERRTEAKRTLVLAKLQRATTALRLSGPTSENSFSSRQFGE
jgi:hypothetical protein